MVEGKVFIDLRKERLVVLGLFGRQFTKPSLLGGWHRGKLRGALREGFKAHANGHHVRVKTGQSEAQDVGVPVECAHREG